MQRVERDWQDWGSCAVDCVAVQNAMQADYGNWWSFSKEDSKTILELMHGDVDEDALMREFVID